MTGCVYVVNDLPLVRGVPNSNWNVQNRYLLKEKNTSISALNSKKILIFCGRFHIYFILYISLLPYYMFVIWYMRPKGRRKKW